MNPNDMSYTTIKMALFHIFWYIGKSIKLREQR